MKNELDSIALSVRSLAIDAIERAKSGHPGMVLGAAELVAALYGNILSHNPKHPAWLNRDRFVLSAGHGSMLLYSILHLAGYDISIDDIKNFRQLKAKCQGHPEYGCADGVEMTTGPLGQGIATAVGMAIAEAMLATKFNTEKHKIFDHYTYVLMGEGCLMEGIASEASSLAGALKLNKLIAFYDANKVSIDGSTDITFLEDVRVRYQAYGWNVLEGSMYSYRDIFRLVGKAKKSEKPTLIILDSIIGYGAPTVQGLNKAHGAPLGEEGVREAKMNLGLDPNVAFFVADEAYEFFREMQKEWDVQYDEWVYTYETWAKENTQKAELLSSYIKMYGGRVERSLGEKTSDIAFVSEKLKSLEEVNASKPIATRAASKEVLEQLVSLFPSFVGGSADLSSPNATNVSLSPFTAKDRSGRYIHYGVREMAMAAITNGLVLHSHLRAFCATFLVFSDYLKSSLRLSALMKIPSIYIFTHDSIFVGEDGATHQPIEMLASLRAVPDLMVLRPADADEVVEAWKMAMLNTDSPTVLVLSRQALPVLEKQDEAWREHVNSCGAYIVKDVEEPDVVILATGSEVSLSLEAVKMLNGGKKVRVVSVLCKELFDKMGNEERTRLLGSEARIITVEAGVRQCWQGYTKDAKDNFSIECFGTSAPAKDVAEYLGFTKEKLSALIEAR